MNNETKTNSNNQAILQMQARRMAVMRAQVDCTGALSPSDVLVMIDAVVVHAERDEHGDFKEPQAMLREIALALGHPVPSSS